MSKNAVEQYNKLFAEGKLEFVLLDTLQLPSNVNKYLSMWVLFFDIEVQMVKKVIGSEYLFKLDHPKVKYLFCDSEAPDPTGPPGAKGCHMWGDKDFENIENNEALALIASGTGMSKASLKRFFQAMDEGGQG